MPVSGDCLDRLVKMKMGRARERVALMNAEYPGFGNNGTESGATESNRARHFPSCCSMDEQNQCRLGRALK